MKKAFLSLLIIFLFQVGSAPNVDFRLKFLKFRMALAYTEKKYHDSELDRFIYDLGSRESGNNWLSVNSIGCFGEWQFSETTLKYLGYKKITLKKFKADPDIFPRELQVRVLKTLLRVNSVILTRYDHYIGDTIAGVRITRSGMLAASHLGGAGSLKRFLDSGGKINRKDVFGTSIYDYLRIFSNYDLE